MIDVADGNAVYHQDGYGHYYHFDELGSIVAISDLNNVPVERYAHDVSGRPTISDAISAVVGESACKLRLND